MADSTPHRSPLVIVYLTVFLDLLGFGIILPLLPYYAVAFGANGIWLGALMTAYSAAQFIGAPIIGRLSDRYGRRPVLLLTLAGSAISLAIAGSAQSLGVLIAARVLAGVFGGSIAAAQAFIADVTTREQRSKYMGILGAAIGLGFVFGPALGAALARYGFGTAAYVAAGLAAINFFWALVRLPETRPVGDKNAPRPRLSVATLLAALKRPEFRPILGATFFVTLGFVAMETTYALLAAKLYGLDSQGLGAVFTFIGVIIVIVQGGMIGRLAPRYGEQKIATVGAMLLGVALAILPFASTLAASVAVLGLLAAGQGLASPTLTALLSKRAEADEQGGTLGLGQSLSAAARGIGPVMAGALYDRSLFAPFLVAAGLCGVAGALVYAQRLSETRART